VGREVVRTRGRRGVTGKKGGGFFVEKVEEEKERR